MPPFIVLELMRILDGEIDLREETRTVEQAHAGIEAKEYEERAEKLSTKQGDLHTRLEKVIVDIRNLPDAQQNFGKELKIIGEATTVAKEATGILAEPDTGPQAIAAETEVIELLLQAKRMNPNGGGGGGSSPGGGGGGDTDRPALAMFGPAAEENSTYQKRRVRQATGTTGNELPAEFRAGLEVFFDAVETAQ